VRLAGFVRADGCDIERVLQHVLVLCERENVEPIGELSAELRVPVVGTVDGVPQHRIVRWELIT
jgi:hypothetical protein